MNGHGDAALRLITEGDPDVWWVTSVFGVAVGSAILPVFSLEVYLVAVMSTNPDLPWWVCGPAAALGQVLGKGVHYLAARGALKLPRLLRRPLPVGSRYRRWLHDFGERCEQHPRRTVAVVLTSAVSGIPPFGAVVVAAGLTRVPLLLVIPAGVVGRLARYCVLAAVPGMLQSWIWV